MLKRGNRLVKRRVRLVADNILAVTWGKLSSLQTFLKVL